ncbi:MAG: tRNA (adenosine(37)-N6)-dimethylallyltransferase MiaA [Planctomycetes bacterium]|nr:tRNA (adenosine(37)-N6)-dimethylallyltransferase MiaA [Planctomycetota bacterium]
MTAGASDPLLFERAPLAALVGVTGSGKTGFGIELARATGAEVLSLDSMLVYRGLDIGTAKPTAEQRAAVPHHLIDLVEPRERYDLSRYLADARAALAGIERRGRRALFVGGTALYLRALTHGLFEGPPHDAGLRSELQARARELGPARLHAELAAVDPASAARLHPNDEKRIVRALEVWRQTGKALSELQREWNNGTGRQRRLVGLQVEPAELERRLLERAAAMLDAGWAAEALRARAEGLGASAVQALGYADVLEFAQGRITREECLRRVVLRTRQFARRQRTWLRKFPEILWLPAPRTESERAQALRSALAHLY